VIRVNIVAAPRVLILETSSRTGQVALALGDELRGVRPLEEARRNARDLAPATAALLAEQGWRPRDIQAVIVSRGPGSYTGLRVGIMSAKTFAYATGSALIGVETFRAIALQAEQTVRLDVIADAQQDKIYVERFVRDRDGEPWRVETDLHIDRLSDWLTGLPSDVAVTGPGLHIHGKSIPGHIRQMSPEQWDTLADSLLQIGLARFHSGERDEVWKAEPIYLRPSSAEEQKQALRAGNPPSQGERKSPLS
jgi:tRNA threonylcarbamoyladenosine biosynthesis protein TsaB